MRRAKRLKAAVGFESSVPRCSLCNHFRHGGMRLINSTPRFQRPICNMHGFNISATSLCDSWECKTTGEKLEQEPDDDQATGDASDGCGDGDEMEDEDAD